jgi:peptidoglycan/xylan/chitin deacetylase (PgdA/CDA1 family)
MAPGKERKRRRRRRHVSLAVLAVGAGVLAVAVVVPHAAHAHRRVERWTTATLPFPVTLVRPRRTRSAAVSRTSVGGRAVARLAAAGIPVYCGGRRGHYVALTFDDGPGVYTRLALRILRRAHARATFFLVGRNLAHWGAFVKPELRLGAVGDHTWTHPDLDLESKTRIAEELGRTQRALERDSGAPVRLFRPPYGVHDMTVDDEARALGMLEVLWTVDSRDSEGATWRHIYANVRAGLRPGAIVLMHENRGQTIEALRFLVLPLLRRLHYETVTIPQLLTLDPPSAAQLRRRAPGCGRVRTLYAAG